MTEKFSGEKRFSITMCSGMGHSACKAIFWCAQAINISVETEPRTHNSLSHPHEQDAPSQRGGALKRSLESWVLGSSSCPGALSAMQLLNGLFLMEYTMRPWGGVISGLSKTISGHPNQVSVLKKDVERMGEVCRRAVRMTRGLKNKKQTPCHSKPIVWNCLKKGL